MDAVKKTLKGDQKASSSFGRVHAKDLTEGNLVWGKKFKFKNYQWWPGLVYSSSDASDLALTTKQDGMVLVTFFGDVAFAWCDPSELKPFKENLKKFSKRNKSGSFLIAVENAVEEIGRRLESFLTCSCVPEDYREKLSRPLAVNKGVKTDIRVPEPAVLDWDFETKTILRLIRTSAEIVISIDNLECELLKRKVSAFYKFIRRYELPKYNELQRILGLEDLTEPPRGRGRPRKKEKSISDGDLGDLGSTPSPSKKKKLSEVIMEEIPKGLNVKNKDLGSDSDDDITLSSLKKRIKLDGSKSEKDSDKSKSQKPSPLTGSLSRERKQSKSLSPAYTTRQLFKEMESNHTENIMDEARAGAVNPICANEEGSSVPLDDFTTAFRDFAYEKPNSENEARESDTETGADLWCFFGPDSSLPTKDNLIQIYGKFGILNKDRTKVFCGDSRARVAFLNDSDASVAHERSKKQNPLDNSGPVTFELCPLLPSSSTDNTSYGSFTCLPRNTNTENALMLGPPVDPDFKYVKEKLEALILMLEESDGRLSTELKTKLVTGMGNVLDRLR